MKGYRLDDFTSLDDLRLQEEDDPRLQRGEVLVRLHAVSLNFRDIAMLRGRYPCLIARDWSPQATGRARWWRSGRVSMASRWATG